MFSNRHVIIALLVAPMLAVIAWFGVDGLVGEQAAPAKAGESYPLVARSNCRYRSGQCDLANEDFKLSLRIHDSGENRAAATLELRASHSLESVLIAVANPTPQPMHMAGDDGRLWTLQLGSVPGGADAIRLVAGAAGSRYFAETTSAFAAADSVSD